MADLKKLDKLIIELEEQSKELESFKGVYSEITKLKLDVAKSISALKDHSSDLEKSSKDINSALKAQEKKINDLLINIESRILSKLNEYDQDNKKFQKEFDSSLVTRLDKHESNTQVEIRNESARVTQNIESNIKSVVVDKMMEQSKEINTLKAFMFFVIVGTIAILYKVYS